MKLPVLFLACLFCGLSGHSQPAILTYGDHKAIVYDFCISKGGSWIVLPYRSEIQLYSSGNAQEIGKLQGGHHSDILAVDLSHDSSMVASGGKDSLLILWNVTDRKMLSRISLKGIVTAVKFSPDNRLIATGTSTGQVNVMETSTGNSVFEDHSSSLDICSLDFSPDGKYMAFAGGDKFIHLVETGTWHNPEIPVHHHAWIREVRFSGDGSQLFSCDDAGKIKLWRINDHSLLETYSMNGCRILGIDITANGKKIVMCGMNGIVRTKINGIYYKSNLGCPVQKIRFVPFSDGSIRFLAGTRGKGLRLIYVKNMSLEANKLN
jgi:WD40 repeat protein